MDKLRNLLNPWKFNKKKKYNDSKESKCYQDDKKLENLNRKTSPSSYIPIIGKSEKKEKSRYEIISIVESFPRIDTPLMVEMWRKGRVFRASAKKPPLQKDRGDVEKGDGEKNGGRWPRKNASLRSAASATKLFFQESRRHRRALLSCRGFLIYSSSP